MISVVIPLYNKEQSITKTLDSVLAQSYGQYECLIVNDGSTDRSQEVVEQWLVENGCRCGCRFRLLTKSNGGVSSARNRGIEEAKGEYIVFLDGDDLWEPSMLEEMARLTQDFPAAAIYGVGSAHMRNGVKEKCGIALSEGYRGVVDNVWGNSRMMFYTSSSVCIPREKIVRFDENLTHGEDLDVWFRMMLQGDAVFYNKTLAYYVQDSENRAMGKMPPIDKHIVSVIDRYRDARNRNQSFRKAFDTQMIYFLWDYMFTAYRKDAQEFAKKLDFSQLKWSLRVRMMYPNLYGFYLKIRSKR